MVSRSVALPRPLPWKARSIHQAQEESNTCGDFHHHKADHQGDGWFKPEAAMFTDGVGMEERIDVRLCERSHVRCKSQALCIVDLKAQKRGEIGSRDRSKVHQRQYVHRTTP